ncbi:MFS transporter [Rhizobium sp. P38BS-XIX]|uniref:MFS transporter n=1 Tax=Rhizobium sp. P38BS-XIX TaxID=2726740 RepID=UPI00145656EB|nr:MFS transporter [Rhizobium sp. P38BS-XIX]NLS01365.1 MFS transporter [Rhizobium sp. P38BS-XIX]
MSSAPIRLGQVGLMILLAGQLLLQLDFSIINVGLAAISASLQAGETELELFVAAYGVAFAVCLAMGARLGDNFGRRRMFGVAVVMFCLASLLCGVATSVAFLIVARALQGLAAALMVPQVLATIHVTLTGRDHARAVALYGAIGGIAFIVGQVLGGFLISANIAGSGWRSIFLINLPICILILVSMWRYVPETRGQGRVPVDWSGMITLALLTLSVLLSTALGPSLHWNWLCLLGFVPVLPLAALLWRIQRAKEARGAFPILPPSLTRISSMRFGGLIAIIFFTSWSGFMFVFALTLQAGAGLTPLQSGNSLIALGGSYFISAVFVTRRLAGMRREAMLVTGCVIQMVGLLLLIATLDVVWPHPGVINLIPASVLIGFGQALIVNCFYRLGLADVPHEHAGAGSAMLATMQQVSLGLGPAILGAVFAQVLQYSGHYQAAGMTAIAVEFGLMVILLASALHRLARERAPAGEEVEIDEALIVAPE